MIISLLLVHKITTKIFFLHPLQTKNGHLFQRHKMMMVMHRAAAILCFICSRMMKRRRVKGQGGCRKVKVVSRTKRALASRRKKERLTREFPPLAVRMRIAMLLEGKVNLNFKLIG
jgi:hypothetical protein